MSKVSRRPLLMGLVGGAIVLGFDPIARSWVTEAEACSSFGWLPTSTGR